MKSSLLHLIFFVRHSAVQKNYLKPNTYIAPCVQQKLMDMDSLRKGDLKGMTFESFGLSSNIYIVKIILIG